MEKSSRSALRICLYTPIPRTLEFKPHPRSQLSSARRFATRSFFRLGWRYLHTTSFRLSDWVDHAYTNRGDIAIRTVITGRLRSLFPDRAVEFAEVGWGTLSAESVESINRTCDLFVIAGGGFISVDPSGTPTNSHLDGMAHLAKLQCPKVAYGIGLNTPFGGLAQGHESDLPPAVGRKIGQSLSSLQLISARGRVLAETLKTHSTRPIFLTGDPAFVYPLRAMEPNASPMISNGQLDIGLNFALHGPRSAQTFRTVFRECVTALHALQARGARFHYFMHCDTERISVEMLSAYGIRIARVLSGTPEELSTAYAGMHLVIGQMLHSGILAAANGVPAICIAYDRKNFTFYDLVGRPDLCIEPQAATGARIGELVERVVRRRAEIAAGLRTRQRELQAATEEFERSLRKLVLEA